MKSSLPRLFLIVLPVILAGCGLPLFSAPTPSPVAVESAPPASLLPPRPSPQPTLATGAVPVTADASPTSEIGATPEALPTSPPPPADNTEEGASASHGTAPTPLDPFALISQESLFAYIEDLTAIQPYSGWRNSASMGEMEALDYVETTLGELGYLRALGLELQRETFRVFLGTELWETGLVLTIDGQSVEVPAEGLRGPRDEIGQALRFDSDGRLNDSERDPVVVEGPVMVVRSAEEISALDKSDLQGKIAFLDYEAIDRIVLGNTQDAVQVAWDLIEEEPAGLVLVTSYSDQAGESHGSFVGDTSALNWVETPSAPPTLYVRLEDLAKAGITTWDDLAAIQMARVTWDADVFSPATSGNLIAHIPGADPSQAVILGAHIDSPNSPGAMDDGSGSAILMEVARVLNVAGAQPPSDLYLVWFGSEELGLYGSSHFVATHQELLDRTQGMLQTDMLSYPLDGIDAAITLVTWSYGRLGDGRLLWPDHLAEAAGRRGVDTASEDLYYVYSDNSSFGGFDVPHADLIYINEREMEATGSVHYAAHIHDPYDTVDLARQVGDVLEQMATVALAAALDTTNDYSELRVAPIPDRRALFVASHTESAHMAPTAFTDLGMALAMEGFDVDLIPYGQAVTAADLEGTDLVVALPVVDYASPEGDPGLYDEAWTDGEIAALESYVQSGGLLVVTNSAHRLKYGNSVLDPNEDWPDVNALATRFGVTYTEGSLPNTQAQTVGKHILVKGTDVIELVRNNSIPFVLAGGEVLAEAGGEPAVALARYGQGEVVVLADVGILGASWGPPANLRFWQNLAQYARH